MGTDKLVYQKTDGVRNLKLKGAGEIRRKRSSSLEKTKGGEEP